MLKLLVFDGDETLWSTMPLYRAAKAEFARLIANRTGVPRFLAIETLERRDRENAKRFGFSTRRFPISMTQSYIELARSVGLETDLRFRGQVQALGAEVFSLPAHRIAGAKRVLHALQGAGCSMILCTKGDRRIQGRRIYDSGVRPFFDKVYVVKTKCDSEFRTILRDQGVDPADACSIGDSVRSDINPALRLGMSAVWLQKDTWSFEDRPLVRSRRLSVVSDIRDLPAALRID